MVFGLVTGAWQSFCARREPLVLLQSSFDPRPAFSAAKAQVWSLQGLHFAFLSCILAFSLTIMPVPLIVKLGLALGLVYITTAPILAQFFRPGLPVLTWVFLFFNSKNIPLWMRPPITVTVLPRLEDFFFADNLSELLAKNTNTVKDIFAWLPYGIIHFSLPFIVAGLIFIFGPPTALNGFGFSFGYMNLTGVIVQNLIFSCAPPWYKVLHGLDKANYQMKGSPGGLARVDKILGLDLYTTGFTNSPLIFGAMPSLHSGCSTMDAIWLTYLWPKLAPVWCLYVMWLWYSTMYLTHHYFIDVVVGSNLALFWFLAWKFGGKLPINNLKFRWDYTKLEFHDVHKEDREFKQSLGINSYVNIDDEEDTVGYELNELDPATGNRKPGNRDSVDVVV